MPASLKPLHQVLRSLYRRSLREGVVDITTASGELVLGIFAALAQFERALIWERTCAGLDAARVRGRNGGRRRVSGNDPRALTAMRLHEDESFSVAEICSTLRISRTTPCRDIRLAGNKQGQRELHPCPVHLVAASNQESPER